MISKEKKATVIGAGLAGCEAAWQLAERGIEVSLYEMKPNKKSPAHKSEGFAELVCSNSLRAANIENAVGLLKEEMRRLNSLIMQAADETRTPAGGALAVDRERFSAYITEKIREHKNIKVIGVEPEKSPLLTKGESGSHGIQGIGANFVPQTLDKNIYDEIIDVKDEDALEYGRLIAKKEGVLVGISSGAALFSAIEVAKRPENKGKTIVALLTDTGERYLSTAMFS